MSDDLSAGDLIAEIRAAWQAAPDHPHYTREENERERDERRAFLETVERFHAETVRRRAQ